MKVRPIHATVSAWRVRDVLHDVAHHWHLLPERIRQQYEDGWIVFASDAIHVKTLEGVMKAELDDWIICGVKGELYPCKPDIFLATYEVVPSE